MSISPEIREKLLRYQRDELTGHHIYKRLAQTIKSPENRRIVEQIAADELGHYHQWKSYTQQEVKPERAKIWLYYVISRVFGFTFGVKLLERGEHDAQEEYETLKAYIPEAEEIMRTEHEHEEALIALLDEEKLRYAGSMVLGLNDALVELTGVLAGLTLAFQNTRLIALSGTLPGNGGIESGRGSAELYRRSDRPRSLRR